MLVTLGIIGIVAAMTLPALISNYKEKQTITAVKTAYSIFSQAFLMLVNEYGSFSDLASWTEGDSTVILKENANITLNALSKYIKAFRTCDKAKSCMAVQYKSLDGTKTYHWDSYPNLQTGILANGTTFWILNDCGNGNKNASDCVQVGFDINGSKKPNIMGEDFFWFRSDKNGKINVERTTQLCDKKSTQPYNGYYCASYIIINGNMDYLKK